MPTIHRERGDTFRFRAVDRGEPPHIHVRGTGGKANLWLTPTVRDGRELSMAPDWLRAASPPARSNLVVEDFGTAIYFADLGEDIGVEKVLGISEEELYDFAGFERGEPNDAGA